MRWPTIVRALLLALVAGLAVVPGTALGQRPIAQFHDQGRDSFPDVICGISNNRDVLFAINVFFYADGGLKITGSIQQTLTNPANGRSVVFSIAGPSTESPPIVDQEAGTVSFVVSFKGLLARFRAPHGPVLALDAGIFTGVFTFDLATGQFISRETIFSKGPHPLGDSDTLFCDVISEALL